MSLKKKLNLSADTAFLINATDIVQRAYALNNGINDVANVAVALLQDVLVGVLGYDSPEYIAVCFDGSGEPFRKDIYSTYQGNTVFEATLVDAIETGMKQFLLLNDIKIFSKARREAVDCIASIASIVSTTIPVAILSADKRLLQSVTSNVCVWDPFYSYEEAYTFEKVVDEIGIVPEMWTEFYALNGDLVNNIPDYLSMGSAEIKKLFDKGIGIETVFLAENWEQIKDKHKDKFIKYREELVAARNIATLDVQTFEFIRLEDFAVSQQEIVKRRFHFPFILPQYAAGTVVRQNTSIEVVYEELPLVNSVDELPQCTQKTIAILLANQIDTDSPIIAIDGGDYRYNGGVSELITYARFAQEIIVLDLNELYGTSLDWQQISIKKFMDLRIAAFLLNSNEGKVSWAWFGQKAQRRGIPTRYMGQTVIKLANYFHGQLVERGLDDWMYRIELPMRAILFDMEKRGVCVDEVGVACFKKEVSLHLENINILISKQAGKSVNIASAKQVGELLYDNLKLRYKGSKKRPQSTAVEDLERLDDPSGFVDVVIKGRQLCQLQNMMKSLTDYICQGLVHTTFKQTGCVTGRIYTRKPDLQSLPKSTKYGRKYSQCFIAGKGKKFVSADYSQAELVVLANYSSDTNLLKILNDSGGDVHTKTAAQMYKKAPHLVTTEERNSAKEINYGLMNGMTSYSIATKLGVSPKEAKNFWTNYMDTFAGVKKFLEKIVSDCRRDGGVYSLAGRYRAIPEINSSYFGIRARAERQAVSSKMQGAVADILRCAMCNVANDKELLAVGACLVLEKHDELVLEVPEEHVSLAAARLVDCMTQIELCKNIDFQVPLQVSTAVGSSLGDLK